MDSDSVADPHHFVICNPVSLFTLMRIRIRLFTSMRIRTLFLINVIRICDQRSADLPQLHFEPLRLLCKRSQPSLAPFVAWPQLLNFVFDADPDLILFLNCMRIRILPLALMRIRILLLALMQSANLDPAFHCNAYPGSASQNVADPDPQHRTQGFRFGNWIGNSGQVR
jgi:hypothetical protein